MNEEKLEAKYHYVIRRANGAAGGWVQTDVSVIAPSEKDARAKASEFFGGDTEAEKAAVLVDLKLVEIVEISLLTQRMEQDIRQQDRKREWE